MSSSTSVYAFSSFHTWPDLVRIKILQYLPFKECLNLRLISRNWCAGVVYTSKVWSVKKPSQHLIYDGKYLTRDLREEFRYDSISTLYLGYTHKMGIFALPNAHIHIPQFDKLVVMNGNSSEIILALLKDYCTLAKSLLIRGCCLSEMKPSLLGESLNLQCLQELHIDMSYWQWQWLTKWNCVANQLLCLAKLLENSKFPFLQTLTLGFAMDGPPERIPREHYTPPSAYEQFTLAFEGFLKSHGPQIQVLSLTFDDQPFMIGIYKSFRFLTNVETVSFKFVGRSVPQELVDRWNNAFSTFKRLKHITTDGSFIYDAKPFELLLGGLLKFHRISSLNITHAVFNLNWLYLHPCRYLKYLTLEISDGSFGDFENSSYKLDCLIDLKIKFIVVEMDNRTWRDDFVKWVTKITPNIQTLIVEVHSRLYFTQRSQQFNQYNLKSRHISKLIHGLQMLTKLKAICPCNEISDQLCCSVSRRCDWIKFNSAENDDAGFEVRIRRA